MVNLFASLQNGCWAIVLDDKLMFCRGVVKYENKKADREKPICFEVAYLE